jgi:hypothetical protein
MFLHPLPECRDALHHFRIICGIGAENGDSPDALGLRRERPRECHAAEYDEFAPSHVER